MWDAPARALHWSLVAAVLCWATTTEAWSAIGLWHELAGWVGCVATALRVAWGFAWSRRCGTGASPRRGRAT